MKEALVDAEFIVAIRLRGLSGLNPVARRTLRSLRLDRKHRAVILEKKPETTGMLKSVKDIVTWGDAGEQTIDFLLKKRGRITGGQRLTDEIVKSKLGKSTVSDLATALARSEVSLDKLWSSGVKSTFRLRPPRGGFKGSIKRPFKDRGELGNRGTMIHDLVTRMA